MRFETLPDGERIPVLGLGTWTVGGTTAPDRSRGEEHVAAIRTAIELGYSHIDTAEMYGDGHTEELVGRAIKGVPREELFVTTKVWSTHLGYRDVLQALTGSLERLDTDYVDLYLIHWPNPSVPLEETFEALNRLVEEGRVRRVGVSNFNLSGLKRAQELCETPLATDQVPYNVLERQPRKNGVLEHCQRSGTLLTAYEPLGKGRVLKRPELAAIAERYGATPAQIAIHWLVRQPQVITIPKSGSPAHLEENLRALELVLSPDDLEQLNRLGEHAARRR